MVEGFADPSRSDGADSVDIRELGVSRLYDRGNAADVSEQGLCQERSADRGGGNGAVVERRAFDQQVRSSGCRAQSTQLAPEAFDDDVRSGLGELATNRSRFMHVHDDPDHLNPHVGTVPNKTSHVCTYRPREARTS